MKMSLKLIILFSALAVAVTFVFSAISFRVNIDKLYETTYTSLNTMGSMMQTEIEQYVELMDYALEELTSNIDFMDAFYTIHQYGDSLQTGEINTAQTTMSRIMYQAPLQSAFYRVSAYADDGFFLTSRFEKTDEIVSFSEEALEIMHSLDYLSSVASNPFRHVIIGPHSDPWTIRREALVFSDIKAVIWHGSLIGYLEVSAPLDDLADIFLVLEQEGISTQAVFDDGSDLFRTMGDDITYPELVPGEMMEVPLDGISDRWVVRQYSRNLGLNIYVSQEVDALQSTRVTILVRSFILVTPLLGVMILVIILISLRLTGSIRRLDRKISKLPAEDFLSNPELASPTSVVRASDREMYHLEQNFNHLLDRLRTSHANEMALREGTLKAQLNALQLQINPHFVYNTLNIISAKGLESGNEEITELCDQFAQMLRYSTDVRSQTATLRNEVENARRYLNLCKARYEDQLEFEINIPEELLSRETPKLTLQPLVENALKHGVRSAQHIRHISIDCSADNGLLSIVVRDNGEGFDSKMLGILRRNFRLIEAGDPPNEEELQGHLGLINTYRRLFYYSKGTIRMEIENDSGAVVEIREIRK